MSGTHSSQGSLFQRNAAAFHGEKPPSRGSDHFKMDKESTEVKVKSVLYERKMREEENAKMR